MPISTSETSFLLIANNYETDCTSLKMPSLLPDGPTGPSCPFNKEHRSLSIENVESEIQPHRRSTRQLSPKSLRRSSCCLPSSLLQKLSSILVMMVIVMVTLNLACYSHLKYIPRILGVEITDLQNDSASNVVCKALHGVFVKTGEENGRGDLDQILLYGFALPLIFISVLASIVLACTEKNCAQAPATRVEKCTSMKLCGDPPLTFLTVLFVVLPSLFISFEIYFYMKFSSWKEELLKLANPAGVAACFALSLFLIPVAKHPPLIKVFGLSFTQALFFHRISGWVSLCFSLIHGILYCVDYGLGGESSNFFKNVIVALYPPKTCWGWDILSSRGQDIRSCYGYWRNFTGTVSLLAFVVLGISSFQPIRRKAYALFISIHIPAAWIMMIGAIAHFSFIGLFLVPNILYYLVTSAPEWIKHFTHARLDKGLNIKSITWIADSNGCYQINLRHSNSRLLNDERLMHRHGAVCKLCVPEISSIWHPFSVIFSKGEEIALLVRPTGRFTTALSHRLFPSDLSRMAPSSSVSQQDTLNVEAGEARVLRPTPTVLVDGFYPAEYRWHERILYHHDSVLLLAGGVGIVPFLTLLPCLIEELVSSTDAHEPPSLNTISLRHLALHWYCREEGLANFVRKQHHLKDLFESNGVDDGSQSKGNVNQDQIQIHLTCYIHITSRHAGDNDVSEITEVSHDDTNDSIFVDAATGIVGDTNGYALDRDCPRNTTITYQYQEDGKLWADSLSSNMFVKSTFFASASILSMLVHWLHYTENGPRVRVTIPRTYPLMVIVLVSFSFGIVQMICDRLSCRRIRNWKYSRKFESVSSQDDSNEVDSHVDAIHTGIRSNPLDKVSRILGSSSNIQITRSFHVCSGRPPINEVVGPLVNAHVPGAFFCGPSTLRKRLKNEIIKKRRERHGIVSTALPCAFYDEHSEM